MTQSEVRLRNTTDFDVRSVDDSGERIWQEKKIARIARVVSEYGARSGRLADVGAFTGWATERFASTLDARSVTCFDMSSAAIERCRARGYEARSWDCDAEPCPADDASFDVVVAADIVEHLVNTAQFVRELWRVTAAGGVVVVSTPNLAYWVNRLRLVRGKALWSSPGVSSTYHSSIAIDPNHIRVNVWSEWAGFFESCGFRLRHRTGYSIFHTVVHSPKTWIRNAVDQAVNATYPSLAFGIIYVLSKDGTRG